MEPVTDAAPRCVAETKKKPTHYSSPHTYRCQLPEGHEGAHEWKEPGVDGRHTISWYGPARKAEDLTRWRYGFEFTR